MLAVLLHAKYIVALICAQENWLLVILNTLTT